MKTITEITPAGETRYEMPDQVYDLIEAALQFQSVRTVKAAVANLLNELRKQVKVCTICKPLPAGPLRGYRANVLIIDDYVFQSEYQQQPIPPETERRWDALGRPIFPDQSGI